MKIVMKKADLEWAESVKERDDWICQKCGTYKPEGNRQGIAAHHIFGRSRQRTRHTLDNGISLCFACHMWAHQNPFEFHDMMKSRLGSDEYDELHRQSLMPKKGLR